MGRSASRDSGDSLAIRGIRRSWAKTLVCSPGPSLPPNSGIPAVSFDHLVGAGEKARRNIYSEAPRGPQIDNQIECARQHNG